MKRSAQLGITLTMTLVMLAASCPGQPAGTVDNQRQKAIALEQEGNGVAAEAVWRAILKAHPSNAEAYAHLGFLEARQERYTEAVGLYRKALALDPAMPGLRLNLGLSLFKSGAFRDAIQTFTPLLKAAPSSSPEALRLTTLVGLAHYGLGEYAAAVPFLKKATAGEPQNLPFRMALAQSCLWSKQFQCVLDVYHEILLLNAESAEADMLAGEAYDEMKNSAGAIQQFRAAAKADPKMPNVHFGLGYLLWSQNQFEEAAKEFQAELVNIPENAEAMVFLADSQIQLNHPEAALPLIEKAIRIKPSLARAHLDLGILYTDAGRHQDALRELKVAARLSPEDPNVHWRLARLYQAMGEKEEAGAEFKRPRSCTRLRMTRFSSNSRKLRPWVNKERARQCHRLINRRTSILTTELRRPCQPEA